MNFERIDVFSYYNQSFSQIVKSLKAKYTTFSRHLVLLPQNTKEKKIETEILCFLN